MLVVLQLNKDYHRDVINKLLEDHKVGFIENILQSNVNQYIVACRPIARQRP
jgi:hypothetical protein